MSSQLTYDEAMNKTRDGKMYLPHMPSYGSFAHKNKYYNWRENFSEATATTSTPGLDNTTLTTDLRLLMPEVLNRRIQTLIEDRRIGRELLDVMRINSETESFLKEFGMVASKVDEGQEVPVGKIRHEKEFISVFKVGIRPLISYEAIADNKFGILSRLTSQAGLAMVKFEDTHIMTVLNNGVPDESTALRTGTNENNHSFASVETTNIAWEDLIKGFISIERENLTPTDMIVHPYQWAQLLRLTEFRNLNSSDSFFTVWNDQTAKAMRTGAIEAVLGMKLHVTNTQTAGTILVIDKANYGILAERQPLLIEQERDVIHQLQSVVYTQRYGAGILNNDGAANVTGLSTTLAGITS